VLVFFPAEFLIPIGSFLPWVGRAEWLVAINAVLWFVSLALMMRPQRQMLHDLAADTIVIRTPRRRARRRGSRRPADRTGPAPKPEPDASPGSRAANAVAEAATMVPSGIAPGDADMGSESTTSGRDAKA
jgi:hypothetical protein